MKPLSEYSIDELLEEIAKRSSHARKREPVRYCDTCSHFQPYEGAGDPPTDYNPCGLLHKLSFRAPDSFAEMNDGEWGHYRRVCADRKEAT